MTGARSPLHIVGVGQWGHAVARQLAAARPDSAVTLLALDSSPAELELGPPRATILAAARPVPRLAEAVDDAAHLSRSPWLSVVVTHPHLQIGPAVAPGCGACYSCWQRRQRQHATAPELDAALEQHYASHPAESPAGHLEPSARLASSVAGRVVDRLNIDPRAEAGWLRQVDLVSRRMTKGRAIGIHGCPRCGLGRSEEGRSHERLGIAMAGALGWTS